MARFYEFEWKLSFGALVTGLIGADDGRAVTVVPPAGYPDPHGILAALPAFQIARILRRKVARPPKHHTRNIL
jgi:hypothetical protein